MLATHYCENARVGGLGTRSGTGARPQDLLPDLVTYIYRNASITRSNRRMLAVLHLDPVLRPTGLIWTVATLRHQSLKTYTTCGIKNGSGLRRAGAI